MRILLICIHLLVFTVTAYAEDVCSRIKVEWDSEALNVDTLRVNLEYAVECISNDEKLIAYINVQDRHDVGLYNRSFSLKDDLVEAIQRRKYGNKSDILRALEEKGYYLFVHKERIQKFVPDYEFLFEENLKKGIFTGHSNYGAPVTADLNSKPLVTEMEYKYYGALSNGADPRPERRDLWEITKYISDPTLKMLNHAFWEYATAEDVKQVLASGKVDFSRTTIGGVYDVDVVEYYDIINFAYESCNMEAMHALMDEGYSGPLWRAAVCDDTSMLKRLLKNESYNSEYYYYALWMAEGMMGHSETPAAVALLYPAIKDPSLQMMSKTFWRTASAKDVLEQIAQGADVNFYREDEEHGDTVLDYALRYSRDYEALQALVDSGITLDKYPWAKMSKFYGDIGPLEAVKELQEPERGEKLRFLIKNQLYTQYPLMGRYAKEPLRAACINDPDNYVNVRSGPGNNHSIISRLNQDELFYCSAEGEWRRVCTFVKGKMLEGYVHESRIQYLSDIPRQTQRLFLKNSLTTYLKLIENFNCIYDEEAERNYEALSAHNISSYSLVLEILPEYFCATKDKEVMELFLTSLDRYSKSTDELAIYVLKDCYRCQPEALLQIIGDDKYLQYLIDADFPEVLLKRYW